MNGTFSRSVGTVSTVPSIVFRISAATREINVVRALSRPLSVVLTYSCELSIRICLNDGSTQGFPMAQVMIQSPRENPLFLNIGETISSQERQHGLIYYIFKPFRSFLSSRASKKIAYRRSH